MKNDKISYGISKCSVVFHNKKPKKVKVVLDKKKTQ